MQRYRIKPYMHINDVRFGMNPAEIRDVLGIVPCSVYSGQNGECLVERYPSMRIEYKDGKCACVALRAPAEVIVDDMSFRFEGVAQVRDELIRLDAFAEDVRYGSRESIIAFGMGLRAYIRSDALDDAASELVAFGRGAFAEEFAIRRLARVFLAPDAYESIEECLFEDELGVAYEELCAWLAFGEALLTVEEYVELAKVGNGLGIPAAAHAPICVDAPFPSSWDAADLGWIAEDIATDPTSQMVEGWPEGGVKRVCAIGKRYGVELAVVMVGGEIICAHPLDVSSALEQD